MAKIFQQTLPWSDSPNPGIQYQWYVFDEGAKFLSEALDSFKVLTAGSPVRTLKEHQFHLVNPKRNMGTVLTKLAQLEERVNKVHARDPYAFTDQVAAKIHQVMRANDAVAGLQAHNLSWSQFDNIVSPIQQRIQTYRQAIDENTCFSDLVKKIIEEVSGGWA